MKKVPALLCAAALLCAGGCAVPEVTELSDRLIIEAVGIDRTDTGFEVTVQALDSTAAGHDENASPESVTRTLTFRGATVGGALAGIGARTGLEPLYSQARLLLLGRAAADGFINGLLDFFLREYTARPDVLIAVAENTAKEILTADFGKNRIGAAVIADALRSGDKTGQTVSIPLYRFIDLTLGERDAAYCPVIGLSPPRENAGYTVQYTGTDIFGSTDNGTLISKGSTLGLRILTDTVKRASVTAELPEGTLTLRVIESGTKIKTSFSGGRYLFSITADMKCDITEFSAGSMGIDTGIADAAARTLSEQLLRLTADTLTDCFYEHGGDICRFGRRAELRYPDAPPPDKDNTVCSLRVNVTIRRTGREGIK